VEVVIEAGSRSRLLAELAEVWRFRGLLAVLVQRDLKVRYKETALGALWAVLQPLALMAVFWLVLGRVLRVPVGDVPYHLFVLAGLVPWIFFANAVSASTGSLLGASHLIRKVYFPRLIIPLSTLGVALVDFLIGSALLLAMVGGYDTLGPGALAALLPLALLVVAAVAVGTLCAALSAIYRDTRYVVPLVMQVSSGGQRTEPVRATAFTALLILLGGFAMRMAIVLGGQGLL